MDTILVVNAGSSNVKFQVFGAGRDGAADRLIKGQMDGIGTRPRLRAQAADNSALIDQSYAPEQVSDVRAALENAGAWLRDAQKWVQSWGGALLAQDVVQPQLGRPTPNLGRFPPDQRKDTVAAA